MRNFWLGGKFSYNFLVKLNRVKPGELDTRGGAMARAGASFHHFCLRGLLLLVWRRPSPGWNRRRQGGGLQG